MKKFGLLIAGGVAALVLVSNLGPIVGLAVSLVVLYFILKQFLKTNSIFAKIAWGLLAFAILMGTASNVPAIMGIAAAYVLYLVYKSWKKNEQEITEENDPFVNFEKQWAQLKNQ